MQSDSKSGDTNVREFTDAQKEKAYETDWRH